MAVQNMKTFVVMLLVAAALGGCAGSSTEVVNYRTYTDPEKGIFYVYDGVLDRAALISGVGTGQTRVYITREGD
jgi:hypothetical protein